ncbi:hypothetical protein H5P28_14240 [Ruficoccus amylovorans]|uniref:Uncharacterized protein n=2 Tax=Ruficoccus amylovorans TaxID=1804625 RepID=A0A842HFX1_9BACT|nr:hypothetical protein [Ruficoccus amylovorans]MBC2595423.1 hypothetical protein [Ruficoccus amylovorans]
MKSTALPLVVLLATSSVLSAQEPSGGTLIEMSGIGGFILTAYLLMFLGRRNPEGKLARFAAKILPGRR